jgi:hypothetical protein
VLVIKCSRKALKNSGCHNEYYYAFRPLLERDRFVPDIRPETNRAGLITFFREFPIVQSEMDVRFRPVRSKRTRDFVVYGKSVLRRACLPGGLFITDDNPRLADRNQELNDAEVYDEFCQVRVDGWLLVLAWNGRPCSRAG